MKNTADNKGKWVGGLDLYRFLFILLIMAHHLYLGEPYHNLFNLAWIYVEFYFIITGYFVMKHFMEMPQKCMQQHGKIAIEYTLKKFKPFIPYVVIAVLMEYLCAAIRADGIKECLKIFSTMPYEMLLLSSSNLVEARLAPIWYLSAMLLTMPVICYIIQHFKDLFVNILCWLIPVLYYGAVGVTARPADIPRAFSCQI